MERFDRYVAAVWGRYGLKGIAIVVAMVVVVVGLAAALVWFFGVDVAGLVRWVTGAR